MCANRVVKNAYGLKEHEMVSNNELDDVCRSAGTAGVRNFRRLYWTVAFTPVKTRKQEFIQNLLKETALKTEQRDRRVILRIMLKQIV
jgi:hypothetical protein